MEGHNATFEVGDELLQVPFVTTDSAVPQNRTISNNAIFVVAVPTPGDDNNRPDLDCFGVSHSL